MVKRTFITKSNTIFKDSEDNYGLNPIGMLVYGKNISRCLLWFDIDETFKEYDKHFLKLTNCGSLGTKEFNELVINGENSPKERACSFDLLAFRIPEFWDGGKGFDNSYDFWLTGKASVSKLGSNWFQAYNGKLWGTEIDESGRTIIREGVYSNDFLANEYVKFSRDEESVIIARQHFDVGNENVNLDITNYVNDVLSGKEENFGIGLMFSPMLENESTNYEQYFGFFTDNTNTFFHPVVESRTENTISDNRYSFYIGKPNKLYFYADFGGFLTDLDELPICTINDAVMPVFRQNKGVYYAEVKLSKEEAHDNEILYDIWSNLKYSGETFDDVELEFVAHKKEDFFKLGEKTNKTSSIVPSLSGINDNEKLNQGDERTIKITFKIPYSSAYELMNNAQYRLYIKDGKREIDVIDWDNIDTIGKENSFKIFTSELIPNEYHIDIRVDNGSESRLFKDKLKFTIVSNVTNLKK